MNTGDMDMDHEFINKMLQNIPTGLGVFDLTDGILEAKFINDGYYQSNRINYVRPWLLFAVSDESGVCAKKDQPMKYCTSRGWSFLEFSIYWISRLLITIF